MHHCIMHACISRERHHGQGEAQARRSHGRGVPLLRGFAHLVGLPDAGRGRGGGRGTGGAEAGPQGAVEIIFRQDIGNEKKIIERTEEYRHQFATPFIAGNRGFIDDIIMPRNTRMRIAKSLRMLRGKNIENPWKKHGNIPL